MRLKHFLSVFLTLLTLSVGQMWGMNSNYTIGSQVTSLVDGDYVAWGTANNNLATSISNNWVYMNSTKADWIVFKVVKSSNSYYLQNTADNKWVYSSAEKKVAFTASNSTDKTAITLSNNIVYGGRSIGQYVLNSTGLRPYKSPQNTYAKSYLYKVNAFSVTYDANGGSGTVPTDNGNYLSGATVTVKTNSGNLSKNGYTFAGWNTKANGTGTDYAASGSATFSITASTTLYAKWESAGCANNVNISKGTENHGTFTLSKTGSQATCDGLSIVITPSAAEHYHVTSVSATTGETGVDNGDGTWTITYAANSTGTSTINVTFTEDTKYTLSYHDGGGDKTRTNVYEGTNLITALGTPAASCDATSTTFVGWTTSEIATKTNTAPTFVAADAVVNSTTSAEKYWAVYAKDNSSSWNITSIDQLTSGSGYATYNGSHKAGGVDYTSNQVMMQSSKIQFQSSAGYIYNTSAVGDDITSIVIESSSENWSVFTSNSAISSTPSSGAISISSSSNTRTFTVSSTGHKFFHIKGGASTPQASSITVYYGKPTDYLTTCCTPLAQINGSFFWTTHFCPVWPAKH